MRGKGAPFENMLRRGGQIGVWLLLALFLLALGRIVSLRLGSGDIYPEYSSFRPDPLGSKAFFESLARLDGKSVRRHAQALERLRVDEKTTVLFLGTKKAAPEFFRNIEDIARPGARVVVSLNALGSHSEEREHDRLNRPAIKQQKQNEDDPSETRGFAFGFPKVKLIDPLRLETGRLLANRVLEDPALPETLSWYGRYCFEWDTNDWETLFEVKSKPVIVQRQIGLGKLVLCADSFLFSNEALARERWPQFLLWTLGRNRSIIFDESHLGVSQGSSIMLLLREFRLQRLLIGFVFVAALWIWKSSLSFVPAYSQDSTVEIVQGKTAREGVVHLLERNISAGQLPEVCLAEWRKSRLNLNQFDAARYSVAEAVLAEYRELARNERNPVETYQALTKILST
jgi:hypothetical protein